MTPQKKVARIILCKKVPEPDGAILTCQGFFKMLKNKQNHGQYMAIPSSIIQYTPISSNMIICIYYILYYIYKGKASKM
jgi:hypothetical protein